MIPDYKLYHGAVLAEIIDRHTRAVTIGELVEEGRLSSYILNGKVGLQIKHSTQRLHPWQFTFTKSNMRELLDLQQNYEAVFIALVCHTDGMVCLTLDELTEVLVAGESEQAWVRVDRRKGEWYSVSGGGGDLPSKKPKGVDLIVSFLSS